MEKSVHDHLVDAYNKHGRYHNEMPYFTRKENPEGQAAYHQREADIEKTFREDMEKEEGTDKYPGKVRDIIYAQAWEDGHAYGFSEVRNHYINLVYFVENIIKGMKDEV